MGLLRNNNARLLAFLFSLGLVAGAVQGCDKGLADKLETKKDDRFDQGSKRLSITASQRYNASMAAKMVFEMAQTIVEPRATRARVAPWRGARMGVFEHPPRHPSRRATRLSTAGARGACAGARVSRARPRG